MKPHFGAPETALRNAAALKSQPISDDTAYPLYVESSKARPPRWVRFFEGQANAADLGLLTASSKAVFLVSAGDRTFALAFGFGRHLIQPEAIEDGFGLRTTLNVIRPNGVRALDRLSFDSLSRHTTEQASHEGQLHQFQIDPGQDLLRAIVGVPSTTNLGTRLSGSDALSLVVPVQLAQLRDFLTELLDHYESEAYQEHFAWVDHLRDVKDPVLRGELEATLVERLKAGDLERTWIAAPQVISWERIDGFRYSKSKKKPRYPDLHLSDFIETVKDVTKLSVKYLKDHRVYAISSLTDDYEYDWQVFRCLYAEIDQGTSTYLLSGGRWYCVSQDFATETNHQLELIPTAGMDLPPFMAADKSEGRYLQRVASVDPGFCLMDQKMIPYGGGHSTIEFCHLYTTTGQLIHVKRFYQSSGLSHLFMQARNSALLFHTASDFREAVNGKLAATHKLASPSQQLSTADYEVVLAIVSRSAKPLRQALPFFSRISAVNTARELSGYGYAVSLLKIETQA